MEFPRHCHKPDGLFVVVRDAEQYTAVTANGWANQPSGHVEKPIEVSYADAVKDGAGDQAPVAPVVDEPKKPGRKKAH